eukprot:765513-Hanusia_phi.AAC.2
MAGGEQHALVAGSDGDVRERVDAAASEDGGNALGNVLDPPHLPHNHHLLLLELLPLDPHQVLKHQHPPGRLHDARHRLPDADVCALADLGVEACEDLRDDEARGSSDHLLPEVGEVRLLRPQRLPQRLCLGLDAPPG